VMRFAEVCCRLRKSSRFDFIDAIVNSIATHPLPAPSAPPRMRNPAVGKSALWLAPLALLRMLPRDRVTNRPRLPAQCCAWAFKRDRVQKSVA
jgi:hypothetical protein